MWAALPVQPLNVKPWPPAAAAKPPPRRHSISMVVQGEEAGALGQAVVSARKSTEPQQYRNAVKPKTKTKPPTPPAAQKKDLEEEQQQPQLSGCDVLMALQRATAQKAKKNKQKKRAAAAAAPSHNDATREKNRGNSDFSRCSRPLCIKPEWRDRLQQLERRLEELAHG